MAAVQGRGDTQSQDRRHQGFLRSPRHIHTEYGSFSSCQKVGKNLQHSTRHIPQSRSYASNFSREVIRTRKVEYEI